jgi:hypothetical protein
MAIATVNVLVPSGGDGPITSIANLVGAKTVVLSGYFTGTYVLLASHDGSTFVPVLTFDSSGLEEIRQTLSEAYASVRIRTKANTVPASVVSLSVSGINNPGANLFATLAVLPASASGPQPVFDTAIPFPPTGLEQDINFICAGSFLDTIIVEGSTNGATFNQIGYFNAGPQKRTLLGLSQTLEFTPLPTADKVRYVRINVQGQILVPTTITIGGAILTSVAPPSSTTLAQAYANGTVPADQMLVLSDIKGGGVVIDGSGVGFTGGNSFDIKSPAGGEIAFPRVGGLSVLSSISKVAGPAVVWDEASFRASTLTLTGVPAAVAALAMVRIERGLIQGIGNVVSDAYDLLVNPAPTGSATLTRSWSIGAVGAIQAQAGLALGTGLAPPGENDLVFGPGATAVSQANSGRLGYRVATQDFAVSTNTGAYVPLLVAPTSIGFTQGSVPFGSATGTLIEDNPNLYWDEANKRLGIDVAATPTARIHVAGVTAASGTASFKLNPGILMTVAESGAVESDGVDLWWTTALGARVKLNNSAATLAAVYAAGTVVADQTMVVLDAKGGGIVVNATTPLQTFVTAFEIDVIGGNVNFYRVGGFDVASTITKAAAAGTTWDEVALLSSALTLTGGPTTVTQVAQVRVGSAVVNGPGNTVSDSYDLLVDAAPSGSATLTRAWSAGFTGAVQAKVGFVLGAGLAPPGESDLVVGPGATSVSAAGSGRLGYRVATQDFAVSTNTSLYVPLLIGPTATGFTTGSVPFGIASGQLSQDNASLFWDNANKYLGVGTNGPSARLTVTGGSYVDAAGTRDHVLATATFAPVGGTAAFNQLDLQYAVDQTGGANGRVVGLYIAATETAVGGLHYPIDVFAGAGGVTEIFRITNSGTIQTKQGITLGLGLAAPGESDLAIEASATVLSEPNTGRLGYRTSTQQFYVSMNGGAYVPIATGAISVTLAQAYAFGAVAADQTFVLLDAKGGGLVVDGTNAGYTGTNVLAINGTASGFVLFPRAGGMSVVSSVSVVAAIGSAWDEVAFLGSTLTLTGGPATSTKVAQVHVGQGAVNGVGNTVTDSYDFLVDAAPTGTATLTRSWSAGFTGAVQAQAGVVLGAGLAPPGESDLVVGTGATSVSAANTGRLGYVAGATQKFVVSQNGGAYVALLTSVTLAQSYAFGTVTADQTFVLLDVKGGGLVVDGTNVGFTGTNAFAVNVTASGSFALSRAGTGLTQVGAAYTGLGAGVELVDTSFNLSATKQWATGALATQRDFLIQARTYAFVGASIVTTGATLAISGPPSAGANATITNPLALWVQSGVAEFAGNVGVGILQPTARLHLAAVTTTAGTASLKIVAGTLMTVPEQGAMESNGTHLYWTDSGGVRQQLDGGGGGGGTLATDYASGTVSADQTMVLLDAKGGEIVVDGSNVGFTGTNTFEIRGTASSVTALVRLGGGLSVTQGIVNAGLPTAFLVMGAAHTAITTSTEDIGVNFNFSATKQWATGALATQREVLFQAPTYAFVGASILTTGATVAINGAPIAGSNATITNPLALWAQHGDVLVSDRLAIGYPNSLLVAPCVFSINTTPTDSFGGGSGPGPITIQASPSTTSLVIGITTANKVWMQALSTAGSTSYPLLLNVQGGGIQIGTGDVPQGNSTLIVDMSATSSNVTWRGVNFTGNYSYTGVGTTTAVLQSILFPAGTVSSANSWTITDVSAWTISPLAAGSNTTFVRNWAFVCGGNFQYKGGIQLHVKIVNSTPYTLVTQPAISDCVLQVTNATATTINLPAISIVQGGWTLVVIDSRYNAAVANIILVPNGTDKINNVAGNYTMNVNGMALMMVSNGTTNNWEFI